MNLNAPIGKKFDASFGNLSEDEINASVLERQKQFAVQAERERTEAERKRAEELARQ